MIGAGGLSMQRVLGVAVVVLATVAVIQLVTLRRMRVEIGQLRTQAVEYAVDTRGDEIERAGKWLHAWLQTENGGSMAGGLCPAGSPDLTVIRQQIFGTYLRARAHGATEAGARLAVISSLKKPVTEP